MDFPAAWAAKPDVEKPDRLILEGLGTPELSIAHGIERF